MSRDNNYLHCCLNKRTEDGEFIQRGPKIRRTRLISAGARTCCGQLSLAGLDSPDWQPTSLTAPPPSAKTIVSLTTHKILIFWGCENFGRQICIECESSCNKTVFSSALRIGQVVTEERIRITMGKMTIGSGRFTMSQAVVGHFL